LKLAIVPFHYWIGDVYDGSHLVVTLFLSTIPKITFVVLLVKLYFVFFSVFPVLSHVFYVLALFSIFFGTIISLYQEKIKRLLAYGTIVHMGFILLSLSLQSTEATVSALLYLVIYIILTLNVFSVLLIHTNIY
jgi:NADH-quinone oxidoreductase subunit N